MNAIARPRPRPRPSPRTRPRTKIESILEQPHENQRALYELWVRMHTGRWPLFRTVEMRRMPDGTLCEVAQWRPDRHDKTPAQFTLTTWRADGLGLMWRDMTRSEALKKIRQT